MTKCKLHFSDINAFEDKVGPPPAGVLHGLLKSKKKILKKFQLQTHLSPAVLDKRLWTYVFFKTQNRLKGKML